jgi:hypothetical protein
MTCVHQSRWPQLWALGLVSAVALPTALIPSATAGDCKNPIGLDAQERTRCSLESTESSGKKAFDTGTGLQVVELTTDLDWKNANKASIPWSKVVKIRSALDGTFELAVFDRDYTSDFSTGAKEGVATKWTIDTLKGVVFSAGGCGFWTCTYGRGTVADLPDVVELHTSGKSYRLYGSSGEFPIPQAFIDDLLAAVWQSDPNLGKACGAPSHANREQRTPQRGNPGNPVIAFSGDAEKRPKRGQWLRDRLQWVDPHQSACHRWR